jgi:beta-xylosidase
MEQRSRPAIQENETMSNVHWRAATFLTLAFCAYAASQSPNPSSEAIPYLQLSAPRRVLPDAQAWEGNEFPHTLSVLEMKRGGFRYWGWYGLNEGRGIGLARSNDLVNWTKYEKNPLWTNARWPSVLQNADRAHPKRLYFAITRDYDTPSSYIVLANSEDGIHLTQEKTLVQAVPNERNQNPNLFRDPRSGRFYLTFYRGNDHDHFEIVSRNAATLQELDKAPEKVLLQSSETVAAPTLLYLRKAPATRKRSGTKGGIYYLATEIYPHRYTDDPEGEWQVKVFAADAPDGNFQPVEGDPILRGQRACLFQNVFGHRFYGYDCHLDTPDHWVLEVTEASLP